MNKFSGILGSLKSPTESLCLFFTNDSLKEVEKNLKDIKPYCYVQPGQPAMATITLNEGTEVFKSISTSNAEHLRNLGLDITVKDGNLVLKSETTLIKKGEQVNTHQAKILKMLGIKFGKFSARVHCHLDKKSKNLVIKS